MRRVLALDLGSSSVRGVVCDEEAEPIPGALARRTVFARQDDDGRGELDPDAYTEGLVECLDELSASGALDGVDTVACSSQWHSVLALDPGGKPLTGAMTWLDTRAQPDFQPADPVAFHERTGAYVHTLYWSARLPYLSARLGDAADPSRGARGGARRLRFLGLPDYVRHVLLGDDATSISVASGTGMLNLSTCDWDDEAVELAGVTRAQLPKIRTERRRLTSPWRERWPALAGADWHPVLGDGAASNLGSGCATDHEVAITVGTSMALRVTHGNAAPPPSPTVWRYRVDAETQVSGIAFSGGGVLYARTVDLLNLPDDHDPENVRPGASGLLVVPMHAGSRPPGTIPPGSGLVAGLSLDTTADEYLAATMDGVAIEAARALEHLEELFQRRLDVVLGGGAAHASAWWRQCFAAALNRPVRLAYDAEVGARGAAAQALGITLPRPDKVIHPLASDAANLARTRRKYDRLRVVLDDADINGSSDEDFAAGPERRQNDPT